MQYTTLGNTGLRVSVAGLGTGGFSRLGLKTGKTEDCLLYTSPSPRDGLLSRMPSSA